eukprot:2885158-Amphidinium_carterae.1
MKIYAHEKAWGDQRDVEISLQYANNRDQRLPARGSDEALELRLDKHPPSQVDALCGLEDRSCLKR